MPEGCFDPWTLFGDRLGELDEWLQPAASGPLQPAVEQRERVALRPLAGDALWHDFTRPQKYIALGRAAAEAQLSAIKGFGPMKIQKYGPELLTLVSSHTKTLTN